MPQDNVQAYKWLKITMDSAQRKGGGTATLYLEFFGVIAHLKRLDQTMTTQELKQAKALIEEFLETSGR